MKHLAYLFIISLALLASPRRAVAQALPPDTLLNETFRINELSWPVGNIARMSGEMTTEGYHIRYVSPELEGSSITSKTFALNDTRDYSLEVRLRLRGRAGLQWGYRATASGTIPNDYQMLSLEADRVTPLVALWHYQDKKWEKQFAEPVPAGFDAAGFHTLRVAREGRRVRFYLDSKPVGQDQPAVAWPGPDHDLGLYLEHPGAEAWVSQVLFRHHSLIQLAPGIPRHLRRERLSNGISTTPGEELAPRIAADGRSLFFVRSMGNPEIPFEGNADIFVAERGAGGRWGEPHNLGRPVNTPLSNTTCQVAPDGLSLLVDGLYDAAGHDRAGGVSQTTRQADGSWSSPRAFAEGLVIPNVGEHCDLSIDASGTVALASGDTRNDHHSDLYVSLRRPDGSWPQLVSLGPSVNTAGHEKTPFLAADGKTLYFASDGYPGYGGLDIFVTHRLDDTWTRWSPPLNLGLGVNSPRYELYFSLPASGEYAYLVSEEPGAGAHDSDIYRLLLPPPARPAPTLLVRGRVLDARTHAPIANAEMRYEQLPAGKEVGRLQLSGSGTYEIVLPAGQQYGFRAEAPGYVSASNNLDLSAATAYAERTQDLYLLPLAAPVAALPAPAVKLQTAPAAPAVPGRVQGVAVAATSLAVEEKITLNNVFFVQGKPVLLPSSFPELQRLAQTLQANPTLRIRLDGHTDNTGDAKDPRPNQVLSEQRAEAVRAYLVGQRIEARRLSTRGYGGSRPVAPNDTEAHKAQNRRVEFVIVSR